jgi:hypothetical protein
MSCRGYKITALLILVYLLELLFAQKYFVLSLANLCFLLTLDPAKEDDFGIPQVGLLLIPLLVRSSESRHCFSKLFSQNLNNLFESRTDMYDFYCSFVH